MTAFVALTWTHLSDPVGIDQRIDRAAGFGALIGATLAGVSTFAAGGSIWWVLGAGGVAGLLLYWFWYGLFSDVVNTQDKTPAKPA